MPRPRKTQNRNKTKTSAKLKVYNLHTNESKTKEDGASDIQNSMEWSWLAPPTSNAPPDPRYKNINLLGTKLDAKSDIQARKAKYFVSERLSISHKLILLFNLEIWNPRKLHQLISQKTFKNIPQHKIPQENLQHKLYTLTKQKPLSGRIRQWRLTLLGAISSG